MAKDKLGHGSNPGPGPASKKHQWRVGIERHDKSVQWESMYHTNSGAVSTAEGYATSPGVHKVGVWREGGDSTPHAYFEGGKRVDAIGKR